MKNRNPGRNLSDSIQAVDTVCASLCVCLLITGMPLISLSLTYLFPTLSYFGYCSSFLSLCKSYVDSCSY